MHSGPIAEGPPSLPPTHSRSTRAMPALRTNEGNIYYARRRNVVFIEQPSTSADSLIIIKYLSFINGPFTGTNDYYKLRNGRA
jgi:hypothetical protein